MTSRGDVHAATSTAAAMCRVRPCASHCPIPRAAGRNRTQLLSGEVASLDFCRKMRPTAFLVAPPLRRRLVAEIAMDRG